ncbi:MAG TPA: 3-phosphoshikimate 1-carboxyvinyltransferase, partial [Oligoflexia bacterium]|nr:3-phosphoshikimate 1-carboxyvinyltransferase [Oligoflexia bacterium]
ALACEEGLAGFKKTTESLCRLLIHGAGVDSLGKPDGVLDCGNSGTTARLIAGVLAGRSFSAELTGDDSLRRRPFLRITEPLSLMGASFSGDRLPFAVSGGELRGIEYRSVRASAQVKSAVILAGLQAAGQTVLIEPRKSRDHTELMLQAMGAALVVEDAPEGSSRVTVSPCDHVLAPLEAKIPGDFSAAAFFLVAGSIYPGSRVLIRDVGFNPTRTGLFAVLQRMGAAMKVHNQRVSGGEVVVDLEVQSAPLRGVDISADDVVLAIDEIPILAVACAFADGVSHISGAEELRVKESDRLAMIAALLRDFGVVVEELSDGLIINGSAGLRQRFAQHAPAQDAPAQSEPSWRLSGDHRIAMCGAVVEGLCRKGFVLEDAKAVETSFPEFVKCFETLGA